MTIKEVFLDSMAQVNFKREQWDGISVEELIKINILKKNLTLLNRGQKPCRYAHTGERRRRDI